MNIHPKNQATKVINIFDDSILTGQNTLLEKRKCPYTNAMKVLRKIPRWRCLYESVKSRFFPLNLASRYLYKYGPTMKAFAGGIFSTVLTIDPDLIQYILRQNQRNYIKSKYITSNFRHFYGNGLLTSEGPHWLKQRRLIAPGFHKQRLKEVLKLMDRVTNDFLNEFDQELKEKKEVDIYEKMLELTFRVIANAMFSSDLEEAEFEKIKNTLPNIQAFVIRLIRQPYLKWWYKLSGKFRYHEILREEVNDIIRNYIKKRRASGEKYDDFLQMLLDIRYDDGSCMADEQLIDEVSILFFAGHETTANALSWAWFLLNKHPDIWNKLRAEVQQVAPDGEVNYEHIGQLGYTQQVIEETLRLYPPIWATSRMALEDDEFKGWKIKKGTSLDAFIYAVHRSPDHWEAPETFNPDRFTKENKKTRHPFAFVPFGGGPRLCIGKQFGLMEMKMILAKMAMRYDMELQPDQEVELLPLVNLQPKHGIKLQVARREYTPKPIQVKENTPRTYVDSFQCPFLNKVGDN